MKELKCNKCFNPLIIVEYDIGIFVEPCKHCNTNDIDKMLDDAYDDGYTDCLIELKDGLTTIRNDIDDSVMRLDFTLSDIKKSLKERENE